MVGKRLVADVLDGACNGGHVLQKRKKKESPHNEGMLRASGLQWVCSPILEGWELVEGN